MSVWTEILNKKFWLNWDEKWEKVAVRSKDSFHWSTHERNSVKVGVGGNVYLLNLIRPSKLFQTSNHWLNWFKCQTDKWQIMQNDFPWETIEQWPLTERFSGLSSKIETNVLLREWMANLFRCEQVDKVSSCSSIVAVSKWQNLFVERLV